MKRTMTTVCLMLGLLMALPVFADSPGPNTNPYRAYPPSCLAFPLPTATSGPTWSGQVTLPVVSLSTGQISTNPGETVTVTFWRSPCSSGTAALLGRFERSADNEGNGSVLPIFPGFYITQASTGTQGQMARIASEPNTVVSNDPAFVPTQYSFTFVVENFPDPQATLIDFTQAMNMTIAPSTPTDPNTQPVNIPIPAYDSSQYADASMSLPITGYLTGNWYDPTHSGEGLQTEIGEFSEPGSRYITIAWYTYASDGTPYWIFGQAAFTAGDRSATLQMAYGSGGRFAGNFGASSSFTPWGIVTVNFPDCNTIDFSYASDLDLPSGVPQGLGNKQWIRLTQMNGLACE